MSSHALINTYVFAKASGRIVCDHSALPANVTEANALVRFRIGDNSFAIPEPIAEKLTS